MDSTASYVLWYWAASGFLSAALFLNLSDSFQDQRPDSGWKTPFVRAALNFVFGGALLPMVFFITGGVNAAALLMSFLEKRNAQKETQAAAGGTVPGQS